MMVWSYSKQYYTLPKSLHADIFVKIIYVHKGALRRAMSSAYTKWQNSTSTTRTSLIHSRKKNKKSVFSICTCEQEMLETTGPLHSKYF